MNARDQALPCTGIPEWNKECASAKGAEMLRAGAHKRRCLKAQDASPAKTDGIGRVQEAGASSSLLSRVPLNHCPAYPCQRAGAGNQEAVWLRRGRRAAAEAGNAVMVIFHPLVKVIIFPTSFSAQPLVRPTGRAKAPGPRQMAGASGIKVHRE